MKKRQEETKTTKSCVHRKDSEEETDTPWYIIPINLKNTKKLLAVAFFISLLMLSVYSYSSKRKEELERNGVNVEAVVFFSKRRKDKGGPPYRDIKVYFHLNDKYEEQRVHAYPPKHSSSVPDIAVGDTIYIRVVPGKTDNNAFLSKKIHRIQ